jgi:hypothetical protein
MATNDEMADLIDDPEMGQWTKTDDGMAVYTPNMGFFDTVTPAELAKFFADEGGDDFFLHLP